MPNFDKEIAAFKEKAADKAEAFMKENLALMFAIMNKNAELSELIKDGEEIENLTDHETRQLIFRVNLHSRIDCREDITTLTDRLIKRLQPPRSEPPVPKAKV